MEKRNLSYGGGKLFVIKRDNILPRGGRVEERRRSGGRKRVRNHPSDLGLLNSGRAVVFLSIGWGEVKPLIKKEKKAVASVSGKENLGS